MTFRLAFSRVKIVGIEKKMILKIIFVLLGLSVYCISFEAVLAKPNPDTPQDLELITHQKKKRDLGASVVVAALYGIGLASMSIANANKCSATAGCHKGKCWAWCGVSMTDGEWCYTTKTYSQSFEYVPCEYDSDCNECWKCAGSCTL